MNLKLCELKVDKERIYMYDSISWKYRHFKQIYSECGTMVAGGVSGKWNRMGGRDCKEYEEDFGHDDLCLLSGLQWWLYGYIYEYMSELIRVYILKIFTLSYENYTSMKLVQKTHYFKDKIYVELRG